MLYLYGVGGDFRREASGRLHALLGDDSFAGWRRFLYGRSGAVWNRKEKEVCAFPLASVRAGGKHIPFFLYLRLSVVKKHN